MESPPSRTDSTLASSGRGRSGNGSRPKSAALVPTNNVTTKSGVTVRARIDPTLTVDDVVRQLCINLKIRDAPAKYALRDESDELVTNDNLRKMIKAKLNLKYVVVSFSTLSPFPCSLTEKCDIPYAKLMFLTLIHNRAHQACECSRGRGEGGRRKTQPTR
jgi:hypothetical protein